MDAKGVLDYSKKNNAKILDLRFIDVPGIWQHVSYPIGELSEDSFKEGFGFDASSIRGWASIHESDMLLMPDPNTAFMDPFRSEPTLVMIGDATDPLSKKPYHRDPRHVAKRAEAYLASTGIADKVFFGAEAEFFRIFDSVRFDQASQARLLFYRLGRRPLERRARRRRRASEPRLPYSIQGRLFPGSTERPFPGPAHQDGFGHAGDRNGRGVPPPRSGHSGTGGDRPALQHTAEFRRQHDEVQIHHQEYGCAGG